MLILQPNINIELYHIWQDFGYKNFFYIDTEHMIINQQLALLLMNTGFEHENP
jgi:hypothetical protein